MTPDEIAKAGCSEHAHQRAVMAWVNKAQMFGIEAADDDKSYEKNGFSYANAKYGQSNCISELKWFHAIPNGGSRGDSRKSRILRGSQLKLEGVRKGISDLKWDLNSGFYCGLAIELKDYKGEPSKEQLEYGNFLTSQRKMFTIAYGWKDAVLAIKLYISLDSNKNKN